jgi:diketogulonate reductase-like aldo/keto reductase
MTPPISRRTALGKLAVGALALPSLSRLTLYSQSGAVRTRKIPSSGESLPVVGLGTWITFNVGDDRQARDDCARVMQAFFEAGGRLIDSSPMYGSSQSVIGYGVARLKPSTLFAADKVWTSSGSDGRSQIEETRRRWGVQRLDLVQVHNLLNWEDHLRTLLALKGEGRIRYVGITTSEGRRHDEIERVMRSQRIDFVQVTYNAADREVERRILPLAAERGIAVIVNRPFRQGDLTSALRRRTLPAWAREVDCTSWAQLLIKFIVSHPAVTCTIPATTSVTHVRENLAAATGRMPDESMRARIAAEIARL